MAPSPGRGILPSASRLSRNAHGEGLDGNRRATGRTPTRHPDRTACDQGERTRRTDGRPAARPRPGPPDATRTEPRSFSFPLRPPAPEPLPRSASTPRAARRGIAFLSSTPPVSGHDTPSRRICPPTANASVTTSGTSDRQIIASARTAPRTSHLALHTNNCAFVDRVDKGIGSFRPPGTQCHQLLERATAM